MTLIDRLFNYLTRPVLPPVPHYRDHCGFPDSEFDKPYSRFKAQSNLDFLKFKARTLPDHVPAIVWWQS